jgi:hypothetical protein
LSVVTTRGNLVAPWTVLCCYCLPEVVIERAENTHYQSWDRTSLLVGTPGAVNGLEYVQNENDRATL